MLFLQCNFDALAKSDPSKGYRIAKFIFTTIYSFIPYAYRLSFSLIYDFFAVLIGTRGMIKEDNIADHILEEPFDSVLDLLKTFSTK